MSTVDEAKHQVQEAHQDLYAIIPELTKPRDSMMAMSTSTGVLRIDRALGGRLPSGAIEIYGEAGVGKTTLLNEIIATAQKDGFVVAMCPTEYLDIPYLRVFGVDLNHLILITGNSGEDVFEALLTFLRTHVYSRCVLVLDSATSLRPKNDNPGVWLSTLSTFLKDALRVLHHGSCIVMVNQVRVRRSISPGSFFVSGKVDSTGKKIIDQFSARLELTRLDSHVTGYTMGVNVIYNDLGPMTYVKVPVTQGRGIDTMRDLLLLGHEIGVVRESGPWLYLEADQPLGMGWNSAVATLEDHPDVAKRLLDLVMVKA